MGTRKNDPKYARVPTTRVRNGKREATHAWVLVAGGVSEPQGKPTVSGRKPSPTSAQQSTQNVQHTVSQFVEMSMRGVPMVKTLDADTGDVTYSFPIKTRHEGDLHVVEDNVATVGKDGTLSVWKHTYYGHNDPQRCHDTDDLVLKTRDVAEFVGCLKGFATKPVATVKPPAVVGGDDPWSAGGDPVPDVFPPPF